MTPWMDAICGTLALVSLAAWCAVFWMQVQEVEGVGWRTLLWSTWVLPMAHALVLA